MSQTPKLKFDPTAINKLLDGLPRLIARKCLRKALRPAAKLVQRRAKELAPRQTGALVRDIRVRALPRSTKFIGVDVLMGKGVADQQDVAYYSSFVEFGTKHQAPDQFMRIAAYKEENASQRLVLAQLGLLVEEAKRTL